MYINVKVSCSKVYGLNLWVYDWFEDLEKTHNSHYSRILTQMGIHVYHESSWKLVFYIPEKKYIELKLKYE